MQVDMRVTPVTSLTKFTRWSGLASMLGGLLFAIGIPLHPLRYGEAVKHTPYSAIHTLIAVALVLALFGLVGLYVRQAEKLGALGLTGFTIAFFGQALTLGGLMTEGFMWPAVAQFDPALVHDFDFNSPVGQVITLLAPVFFGGLVLFAVGFALFGWATWRAGVLPRWSGVLVAIGAVLYTAGGFALPLFGTHSFVVTIIESSGAIPFGLGFIGMGYALWAGRAGMADVRVAQKQEGNYTR
ncbi:MAG: hypothetical protein ACM3N4_12635 [Nitrososphaerota archaeon]